jgi:thioesterase domain-containing protein
VYGDGALYCVRLARLLGPDQPFFTLSSHGTNGGAIPPTIEAMASDHVRTLSRVLPDGPYLLGGFSHGGLVAFEMARQLAAAGHQVPVLVVVDIRARASDRLAQAVGRHYRRSRRRLTSLVRMVRSARGGDDDAHQRRVAAWRQRQWNTYSAIVRAYAPRRYAGVLTLVISRDGLARRSTTDPTLGWGRVVADVRTVVIPGDHLTCVTEHTDVLARHIADALTIAPHRRATTDRWATRLTEPRTAPADGC